MNNISIDIINFKQVEGKGGIKANFSASINVDVGSTLSEVGTKLVTLPYKLLQSREGGNYSIVASDTKGDNGEFYSNFFPTKALNTMIFDVVKANYFEKPVEETELVQSTIIDK